ncbi:DUF6143 family protein [Paenibacillus humicola]|uniref:DUF6143 family protein n=1 Tax=Paenibacillus humicola TaxID=3110540 RepID=UPI00237A1F24|nr:DUF6143 family protein [Paenibacillus humicola]
MNSRDPANVVDITNPFFKSLQGKYFLGEADSLPATNDNYTWAGLANPAQSGVTVYLNQFVISNMSEAPMLSKTWFCTAIPSGGSVSMQVTNANLTLRPMPEPRGQIQFGPSINPAQVAGKPVATRTVPPFVSVSGEKQGYWIIGPGTAIVFTFLSQSETPAQVVLSVGWWEEPSGYY